MNFEGVSYTSTNTNDDDKNTDLTDILTRLTTLEEKTSNIVNNNGNVMNIQGYIVQDPTRELVSTENPARWGTGELSDKAYLNRRCGFGIHQSVIDSPMQFNAGDTVVLFPTVTEDGGQGVEREAGVLVATTDGTYLVTVEMELTDFARTVDISIECEGIEYKHTALRANLDDTTFVTFSSLFGVFSRQNINVKVSSVSSGIIQKRKITVTRLSSISYSS